MRVNLKQSHIRKFPMSKSRGFSLVELMVAMVVGLIIMSGAFSMNSASRNAQKISEVQMDMVADARFAIDMISHDLRHAGSWGGTNRSSLIECTSGDAACATVPTAPAGDCAAAPGWAYNLSLRLFATDGVAGNPYAASCIPAGENYVAGTDILEVRYADANLPILTAGQAYVRSNFVNGRVFVGDTPPTLDSYDAAALTQNYELHAYAYYISNFTDAPGDGIPSLRRVALVNGPALQNQLLIPGVVDLQVQFGIDTTGGTVINSYVDANTIAANDWANVYAVKIWLLMRSDEQQIGIDTTKSFRIAGADAADFGGVDDFRFFLVTSVVNLRN